MSAIADRIPIATLRRLVKEIQENKVVGYSNRFGAVCPLCEQERCRVTTSPGWSGVVRERSHRCPRCGHVFKSIEEATPEDDKSSASRGICSTC